MSMRLAIDLGFFPARYLLRLVDATVICEALLPDLQGWLQ